MIENPEKMMDEDRPTGYSRRIKMRQSADQKDLRQNHLSLTCLKPTQDAGLHMETRMAWVKKVLRGDGPGIGAEGAAHRRRDPGKGQPRRDRRLRPADFFAFRGIAQYDISEVVIISAIERLEMLKD